MCSTGSISDQLGSAVFALGGDESKAGVRAEAASLGLITAAKAEVAGPLLRGHGHEVGAASPSRRPLHARADRRRGRCSARQRTKGCPSSRSGSEPGLASLLTDPTPPRATSSSSGRPTTRWWSAPARRCGARAWRRTRFVGSPGSRQRRRCDARRSCAPTAILTRRASRPTDADRVLLEFDSPGRPGGARPVGGALSGRRGARGRRDPPRRLRLAG